jgi:4-hydroxymandelate oxidase
VDGSGYADEVEALARTRLPEAVHRYFRQGARDSVSALEAEYAWDAYRLVPRVLRDVSDVRTTVSLLGTEYPSPFAIAPTTMQRAAHPDGEIAMARGAADAGALLVLSSNAGSTFEDVAATGVDWWLQMYVTAERPASKPVLERAVAAGAKAVVLTADTPVVATKFDGDGETVWDLAEPSWLRVNFPPGYDDEPGHEKASDLGPQDVDWLQDVTGLPVVVKGVLNPFDARRCVEAGAAAVWVSNHGGRQLDYAVATADALGAVATEVGDHAEVYVDGGVRCGRHALVAGSLGARAVFVGRPPLFALAAGGSPSVEKLFHELRTELVEALRLAGTPDWNAVPGTLLRQ